MTTQETFERRLFRKTATSSEAMRAVLINMVQRYDLNAPFSNRDARAMLDDAVMVARRLLAKESDHA